MLKHSLTIAVSLIAGSIAAQEEAPQPDPLVVREKVREWVRTQQLISEEQSDWEAEKASLTDLNELRKKEITRLDEILAAAGDRATDAVEQKASLVAESESLKAARSEFSKTIDGLEAQVKALIPFLPAPLLEKVDESIALLEATDRPPLQDRYRAVVALLREAVNFQNQFTLHSEMREIEGQSREVQVLYLGLARAFYVDRGGVTAGIGTPTAEGWTWEEKNPLAPSIAETIAVYQKSAAPKLVQLPLQIDAN